MKGGVISIMFTAILIVVFLIITLTILPTAESKVENSESTFEKLFVPKYYYEFNIQDLIVDTSVATDGSEYFNDVDENGVTYFCNDFKEAFLKSIRNNGKPVIVKEIDMLINNHQLDSTNILCNGLSIEEETNEGIRSICTVGNLYYTDTYQEDNSEQPFYSFEPFVHGCYMPQEFISEIDETGERHKVQYYYYLPPLYSDSEHFKDTGVSTRIVISNATIGDDGNCNYNLFVCSQPAIALNENSPTIEIFKYFKYGISEYMEVSSDSTTNNIYPRVQYFDFTHETDKPNFYQILAAIDAGLWEWSKNNFNNKALINKLLKNLDIDKIKSVKYIRFTYTPLVYASLGYGFSYSDCFDWNGINNDYSYFPNIYYSPEWDTDLKDISYDKLSIISSYNYKIITVVKDDEETKEDETEKMLIITPYISICRDK